MFHLEKTYNNLSKEVVNQITDECCENIESLLDELGVHYGKSYNRLYGPCPIHDGDNPAAWNLYPNGEIMRGYWVCRTHGCEKKWKKTLVGFVHGILSKDRGNIPWTEAINYMVNFLGYRNISEIKLPNKQEIKRKKISSVSSNLSKNKKTDSKTWGVEEYRKAMEMPCSYYLNRGYSKYILNKYDIGYSNRTNRSVVPVFDYEHKKIVGMLGRTSLKKCPKCGYYHAGKCPITTKEKMDSSKWKNSPGFEAACFLYNLWFARKYIMEQDTIIITEGPGDIWRLEEAGVHNGVAVFGTDVTEEQIALIESSWCMNIIVCFDNDKAGKKAKEAIKKRFEKTHRLFFPEIEANDLGDLSTEQIKKTIFPIMEKIKEL